MARIKVRLAETAGFCFGVRNALDIATREARDHRPVVSLGKLIHNQKALDRLHEQGIHSIERPEQAEGTVILRAHGVSSRDREALSDHRVVDATCPMVLGIKRQIDQALAKGHLVLLAGNPDHPEVIGLKDGRKDIIVIHAPQQLEDQANAKRIENAEALTLVAQSTLLISKFDRISEKLSLYSDKLEIRNTICGPTRKRQQEAQELAKKLPLIIVVGDAHSSNTRHLVELAATHTHAVRVSGPDELDENWFEGLSEVGVTAGASTPDEVIEAVINSIESY